MDDTKDNTSRTSEMIANATDMYIMKVAKVIVYLCKNQILFIEPEKNKGFTIL